MALNTGINSLDAGAPDITYTGTEGPQDPRMASAPSGEAELYQMYQDALPRLPRGTTFEMFKELLQQSRGSQQGQGVMAAAQGGRIRFQGGRWGDPGMSPGTSSSGGSRGEPPGGGDPQMTYSAPPVDYSPAAKVAATAATEDIGPTTTIAALEAAAKAAEPTLDYDDAKALATYEAQAGPDVLAGVTTGDAGAAEKFYQENPEMNPSYNVLDYEDPDYNLAYEVNTGLKQEIFDKEGNPTGEFGPGPNMRDPDTLEIVPRKDTITPPTDDRTGEGIASVPTDFIPEAETVLADPFSFEDAKAKAIQANYAPTEGLPYAYRERFIDPMAGAVQPGNPQYATGPVFPEYEELLPTRGTVTAAHGGRIGYAGGGISDLRQGFFLGGIGKTLKKAVKKVAKIAKSPVGMAALAYFGGPWLATRMGGAQAPAGSFMSKLASGKR